MVTTLRVLLIVWSALSVWVCGLEPKPLRFLATTSPGLAHHVQTEVLGLPHIRNVKSSSGGVEFEGNVESGLSGLLQMRTPLRLMERVACSDQPINSREDLHAFVHGIPWETMIDPRSHTIKCDCVFGEDIASDLSHSHFSSLTIKNAVVDRFRSRASCRPSVDIVSPTLLLQLYLHRSQATIFRVWSGEDSMHKRGYRRDLPVHKAAIRETSAAAALIASGWKPAGLLCDPMCGSGTIAIEAALLAAGTAPGLLRYATSPPCPTQWLDLAPASASLWEQLVREAKAKDRRTDVKSAIIFASDASKNCVDLAASGAQAAGVGHMIRFVACRVADLHRHVNLTQISAIATNPPWGLRLDRDSEEAWDELAGLLHDVADADADAAEAAADGPRGPVMATVLSGNEQLARRIRDYPCKVLASTKVGRVPFTMLRFSLRRRAPRSPEGAERTPFKNASDSVETPAWEI